MQTSLKTGFAQNFLVLPKKSELPKIWRGCSPPRPPGPYAYGCQVRRSNQTNTKANTTIVTSSKAPKNVPTNLEQSNSISKNQKWRSLRSFREKISDGCVG